MKIKPSVKSAFFIVAITTAMLAYPVLGADFVLPGKPEDTSADVHVGFPATDHIDNIDELLTANPPVRMVWNWNKGNPNAYPAIYKGMYFPRDRQPDLNYAKAAKPLSWFMENHPDWLEYKCDRKTIAFEFNQPSDIPLDIANPEVMTWLERTFYSPVAASGQYQHLDFDNFQWGNGGSWSGQRCGHYDIRGN
jgi:hypothetical protein